MIAATHLTGLEGLNPLGFLAALGVQVLFVDEVDQPRLWWTDDVTPHAVADGSFPVERIVEQALRVFPEWAESPALSPGFGGKAAADAKFDSDDIPRYLQYSLSGESGAALPTALVAEGSLDRSKGTSAKPSDLYFTAGQQKFLAMAQEILSGATATDLRDGLIGPWPYESGLPSLMWDVTDDRNYALSAADPSTEKKLTNPGAEALAILGFSRLPVYAGPDATITSGCAGPWRRGGTYTWPLWRLPAGQGAVDGLLAHATAGRGTSEFAVRGTWYRAWGVSRVLTAAIRRSDQGGYGTFGPPETICLSTS